MPLSSNYGEAWKPYQEWADAPQNRTSGHPPTFTADMDALYRA